MNEHESARYCGCDYGQSPRHLCERHQAERASTMTGLIERNERLHEQAMDKILTERLFDTAPSRATTLPTDGKERKGYPVASGVLDYFPDALVAIARVSQIGNDQHNPGQPLHWAREKSTDEADTMIRHFLERGTVDTDGTRHTAKMAWRALAILQKEIEADKGSK